MQITCPACYARYSLTAALSDDAARKAVAQALKMPAPLSGLLLDYISLFRPAKNSLSWARVNKLLNELYPMINAGQIERNGRAWSAPLAAWQAALQQMVDRRAKLSLPLKNHGYLLEILAGLANSTEAKAEAARIENLRNRGRDGVQQTASGKTTRSVADIVEEQSRKKWDKQLGLESND